jgi:predicted nucleotidyltransferase
MNPAVRQFLDDFARWASCQPDVLAVILVGSHARNEAKDSSDIDLLIVTKEPNSFLEDVGWVQLFGPFDRRQLEDYRRVSSLRVWYSGSHEVEYGFTDETWIASPLDEGTRKILAGGFEILVERDPGTLTGLKPPTS